MNMPNEMNYDLKIKRARMQKWLLSIAFYCIVTGLVLITFKDPTLAIFGLVALLAIFWGAWLQVLRKLESAYKELKELKGPQK
jgi:hypothetical protein